jgi:hypothetical protein
MLMVLELSKTRPHFIQFASILPVITGSSPFSEGQRLQPCFSHASAMAICTVGAEQGYLHWACNVVETLTT